MPLKSLGIDLIGRRSHDVIGHLSVSRDVIGSNITGDHTSANNNGFFGKNLFITFDALMKILSVIINLLIR